MTKLIQLAFLALATPMLGTTAGLAASPAGRFCGEVISQGDYRDIQTSLSVDRDGRLSGTYKVEGLNGRMDGTLAEKDAGDGLTRTLLWTDQDGTGLARLHFTDDYQGFTGSWGGSQAGRFDPPVHSWTGTRCPTSPVH
ncbi:MAG: hypothetical protein ACRECY_06190 [Phyllobacterium sp.]